MGNQTSRRNRTPLRPEQPPAAATAAGPRRLRTGPIPSEPVIDVASPIEPSSSSPIGADGVDGAGDDHQTRGGDDRWRGNLMTRFDGLQDQILDMRVHRFRYECNPHHHHHHHHHQSDSKSKSYYNGGDDQARVSNNNHDRPVHRLGHFIVPHFPMVTSSSSSSSGGGGNDDGYPLFHAHQQRTRNRDDNIRLESPGQYSVRQSPVRLLLGGGILSLSPNQQEDESTLFSMHWNWNSSGSSNSKSQADGDGAENEGGSCANGYNVSLIVDRIKASVAPQPLRNGAPFRGFHRAWHRPVRLLDPLTDHYQLVSFGGQYDIHADNIDTIMLDLDTLQWSVVHSRQQQHDSPPDALLPPGRIAHAAVSKPCVIRRGVYNHHRQIGLGHDHTQMVIFGGFDGSAFLNDVWEFDMWTRKWRLLASDSAHRPQPRCSHSCVVKSDGSQMVIFGGWQGDALSRFNDVHVFDFIDEKWCEGELEIVGTARPMARQLHSAEIIQDRFMIIVGGECNTGMLNDCWILDLDTKRWFEIVAPRFDGPTLGSVKFTQRRGHASCMIDVTPCKHGAGRTSQTRYLAMILHGGINQSGKLDDAYIFEFQVKLSDNLDMRLGMWQECSNGFFHDVEIVCHAHEQAVSGVQQQQQQQLE